VPDLELVAPLGEDSPIARFISRKGEGIHHICFEVRNIEQSLEELRRKGIRLVHERPVPGAAGRRIAFIHPQSLGGVLIELIEKK
jgi:methylmalonyl-CoA/ethylmalonyl-CoA epimerase